MTFVLSLRAGRERSGLCVLVKGFLLILTSILKVRKTRFYTPRPSITVLVLTFQGGISFGIPVY